MKFSISFTIEISRDGNEVTQSWEFLRKQVKQRDNSTCRYCGIFVLDGHVDHVIPVSRDGTNDLDNLVWSCPECNHSKGDKTLEEWGAILLDPIGCTKIEISEPEKPDCQFDLPIRQKVLHRIAKAILKENRKFSRRNLSDILGETQFNKLLKVMLKEGLAEYKNDRPQAGTELTFKGQALLEEFLVVENPDGGSREGGIRC